MPGTIAYQGTSDTTMTLTWTPDTGTLSGVLYVIRYDTGGQDTQTLTSGSNTITVVPGVVYLVVAAGYDGVIANNFVDASGNAFVDASGNGFVDADATASNLLGFSNFLFLRIPSTGEGDDFTIQWKTDYDLTWSSAQFDTDEDRIRIPTNRRGHWMQWEIKGDGQNQRLELRNTNLDVRMHGTSYAARQS